MESSKIIKVKSVDVICENNDFEHLQKSNWWIDGRYIREPLTGKSMHHIVVEFHGDIIPPGYVVHHINHITIDNRYSNLQIVPVLHNGQSKAKRTLTEGMSQYYGVRKNKNKYKKYTSSAWIEGIYYHIGYFDNESDAAEAYDRFIVHKGSFHELNKPDLRDKYKSEPLIYPLEKQLIHEYMGIKSDGNQYITRVAIDKVRHAKRFNTILEAAKHYDKIVTDNGLDRKLNFPEDYPDYKPKAIIKTFILKEFDNETIQISIKSRPNEELIIDKKDYDKIKHYNITVNTENRPVIVVDGKTLFLYRYLRDMNDPSIYVDHIDSRPLNCSSINMRDSDAQKNPTNKKKLPGTSKYYGVNFNNQCKKWRVQVVKKFKPILLEHYDNEEYAARRYDLFVMNEKDSHRPMNFKDWTNDCIIEWHNALKL